MYPHAEARTSFKYPDDGLLQLRDVVQEGELRHPCMLDQDGEECLLVIKNGSATGLTIGPIRPPHWDRVFYPGNRRL